MPGQGNGFPASVFRNLPREVYDCIVEQLEQLYSHEDQRNTACYLRDLSNLSLTSRAWDRAATLQMYRKVWVLTTEDRSRKPRLRVKGLSRLKLLRRTLREHRGLASCVKELELSHIKTLYDNASIEREDIVNQVASLVLACQNLERVIGFHLPYTHSFDRFSHALSTRQKLKEKVWLLSEDSMLYPDEEEEVEENTPYYHACSDPTERFLELNIQHPSLTTLVLHQQQSYMKKPLNFRAIIGSLLQMPSLRHLLISGLSSSSFTNLTLNALPSNLHSLRLQDLPGINDKGLQRFAKSPISTSIRTLKLVDLELNLLTVSAFLSPSLPSLTSFTLSQDRAPHLPNSPSRAIEIPPLGSTSLQSLHWEIRSQATFPPQLSTPIELTTTCLATALLATTIRHNKFPALKRIRVPHDPQGLLQKLCKPSFSALLPCDMALLTSPKLRMFARNAAAAAVGSTAAASSSFSVNGSDQKDAVDEAYTLGVDQKETCNVIPDTRADSATSSPLSSVFPPPPHTQTVPTSNRSSTASMVEPQPCHSRLQAQSRILAARKVPLLDIRIEGPEGQLVGSRTVGGFVGAVGSNIVYDLRPDSIVDEEKWFAGVEDVIGGDRNEEVEWEGRRRVVDVMKLF